MKVYRILILEKPDHFFCWHNHCGQTQWNEEVCGMEIRGRLSDWPIRKNFFTRSSAERLVEKLRSNGARVELLESDEIVYHSISDEADPTEQDVQKAHSELKTLAN